VFALRDRNTDRELLREREREREKEKEKTREPFLSPNVGGEKGCGGDWVEKKKDIAKFYRLT
jgi:hypothetical protein